MKETAIMKLYMLSGHDTGEGFAMKAKTDRLARKIPTIIRELNSLLDALINLSSRCLIKKKVTVEQNASPTRPKRMRTIAIGLVSWR